ncbi:MAG: hypothetical protein IPP74_00480 [Alphaproteobacteria bacterium]|nr:hypothetical protein [Alphaproteobacteria bacterium]
MEMLNPYADIINSAWYVWPILCMIVGFFYRNPRYGMYASLVMIAMMTFTVILKFSGDVHLHWVPIVLGPFYALILYPFLSIWHLMMARIKTKKRR